MVSFKKNNLRRINIIKGWCLVMEDYAFAAQRGIYVKAADLQMLKKIKEKEKK